MSPHPSRLHSYAPLSLDAPGNVKLRLLQLGKPVTSNHYAGTSRTFPSFQMINGKPRRRSSARFFRVARRWASEARRASGDILLSGIGFKPLYRFFFMKREEASQINNSVSGGFCQQLVDKERASFLKHLVEFRGVHLSNRVKNDVVFKSEKALRANEAWLTDFAAFTIAAIQRDGESVPVRAARDLAQNQIRAWKIGDNQCRTPLFAIGSRKWNDNDFAGYRFDHAVSSSGESQSRPRTDSLSSAPLNRLFSSDSFEASSFS